MAKSAFVTGGTGFVDVFAASYRCDDTRAQSELGYRSRSLGEMVSDSYAWIEDEGLL